MVGTATFFLPASNLRRAYVYFAPQAAADATAATHATPSSVTHEPAVAGTGFGAASILPTGGESWANGLLWIDERRRPLCAGVGTPTSAA